MESSALEVCGATMDMDKVPLMKSHEVTGLAAVVVSVVTIPGEAEFYQDQVVVEVMELEAAALQVKEPLTEPRLEPDCLGLTAWSS